MKELKGDVSKMINDYKFNEPNWPVVKICFDFLDEMIFDQHAAGNESTRDNYVII